MSRFVLILLLLSLLFLLQSSLLLAQQLSSNTTLAVPPSTTARTTTTTTTTTVAATTSTTVSTRTTTTTTTTPAPTTPAPPPMINRNFPLDAVLLTAAALALLSPNVPSAAFLVSRTAAISRSIVPEYLLTEGNETCGGYLYEDPALFFESPVLGWDLSGSESCAGRLMGTFVGNLAVGVGACLLLYVCLFMYLTARNRQFPESFVEVTANGMVSRLMLVLMFGFLLAPMLTATIVAAARCAQGFAGALAAATLIVALLILFGMVLGRDREEVFRYRKLSHNSALKMKGKTWQLYVIYYCEPRGIWKWPWAEERNKVAKHNAQGEEQQEVAAQPPPSQLAADQPAALISDGEESPPGPPPLPRSSTAAPAPAPIVINLDTESDSDDDSDKPPDTPPPTNLRTGSSIPTLVPALSAVGASPMIYKEKDDHEEKKDNKNKETKQSQQQQQQEKQQQSEQQKNEPNAKEDETQQQQPKQQEDDKQQQEQDEQKQQLRRDDGDEEDPERDNRHSYWRYLTALPAFDLYCGRENQWFMLLEICMRVLVMVGGIVAAEAVPEAADCYSMRGAYALATLVILLLAFFKNPYAHRLVFYGVVVATACDLIVLAIVLVDPFTGASVGPPVLAVGVMIAVVLCFVSQVYLVLAPRIWPDLEFVEFIRDPEQPPKKPKKSKAQIEKEKREAAAAAAAEEQRRKILQQQQLQQEQSQRLLQAPPVQEQEEKPKVEEEKPVVVRKAVQFNDSDFTDNDDDEFNEAHAVGRSRGAATMVTSSLAFTNRKRAGSGEEDEEEELDLFERLDRRVRAAFYDLMHEDVEVLPRHQSLVQAQNDFEALVDL